MTSFDHENLPKTRRSILFVCLSIIVIENYLSGTFKSYEFSGLILKINKDQIVNGLCIGLLYLWFVATAQLFSDEGTKALAKMQENSNQKYRNSISPSPSPEMPNIGPDPRILTIRRRFDVLRRCIRAYSRLIFITPTVFMTIFVWLKYDGFFRVFPAIIEIVF